MGYLKLQELNNNFNKNDNIKKEYYRDITMLKAENVILNIMKYFTDNDKCLYIYTASHNKEKLIKVDEIIGINLVAINNFIPKILCFVNYFITSNSGLYKVTDINILKNVFLLLNNNSLFEIYIFDRKYEKKFINSFKNDKYFKNGKKLVMKDSEFFIYGIDSDNTESKTGILEYVSFGKNTNKNLSWNL